METTQAYTAEDFAQEYFDDLDAERSYLEWQKGCQHAAFVLVEEGEETELRRCTSGCGKEFTVCTWF